VSKDFIIGIGQIISYAQMMDASLYVEVQHGE